MSRPEPGSQPESCESHSLIESMGDRRQDRLIYTRRILAGLLAVLFAVVCYRLHQRQIARDAVHASPPHVLVPETKRTTTRHPDPVQWLTEHSGSVGTLDNYASRPKAALISLVRNEELPGMLQSMRQLELRWNQHHRYPWVFLSEEPFSDEFKAATSNATSSLTSYELIPREHWSTPTWIDRTRYTNSLSYLSTVGVGKGHLPSYRHMCRWNSGFFYLHPAFAHYDFYWRVEPDVHFFCSLSYDPFRFLSENNLVYGFNMLILDDTRSFPSLWSTTRDFIAQNRELVHPEADLSWLLNPKTGFDYNGCQYFSNFEIGSLNFFRSKENRAYFEHLDEAGGFFYERFGDAPIHTLSLSMFAPKDSVWFFRDIGYQHDIARQCPVRGVVEGKCDCEPTDIDENFYKLVPMESPQEKPGDTCLRSWLGGEWTKKKDGWDRQAEKVMGGDGYGGYVKKEGT